MKENSREMGAQTVFSASDAADAMYYMASAGYKVDQMADSIKATLDLAAATQSDLAFTSDVVISTLNQFGMEASDASRVTNTFAAVIGASQATMEKLAYSMRYVGPIANSLGYSVEETAGALGILYNAGFQGEQAGTVLRSAMSRLLKPTAEMKNGVTQSASGGVYKITVGAGNYYLAINYAAQSVSSSISFAQAESITTNTLTKSGFTVNFNINIRVKQCAAGSVIGTVPLYYRPGSAKTYTTNWKVQTGSFQETTQAKITIRTDGSIVSDTESTGSGSDGGGAKWGSYVINWYTQISISGSWSTR